MESGNNMGRGGRGGAGIRRIEDDVRGKERTETRNWGTILLCINYMLPQPTYLSPSPSYTSD